MSNNSTSLKTIVDFARRKGFVFQSSEIYGGFAATYDFGPLGKLLKDNLVNSWRDWMVNFRTDTVEIEGAIFLHPKVWEASGHIGGFSDLLVEDLVTKKRFRADHLVEEVGIIWPLTKSEKLKNIEHKNTEILAKSELLIATHNPSKAQRYQKQLVNLSINLVNLADLDLKLETPIESGNSTLEIVKNKVKFYFDKTQKPCFSNDSGLFFEGVEDSEQPGSNVKGIAGATDQMSQEEVYTKMIDFYQNLATKYGGELKGYFLDSFALFDGQNYFIKEVKRPILLTNRVNKKDIHFPICTLYKVKDKYYHDLGEGEMTDFLAESVNGLKEIITKWLENNQVQILDSQEILGKQENQNSKNEFEKNTEETGQAENFHLPFIIHFAKNNQNKIWPKSIISHFQKLNSQSENKQDKNLEQKINTLIQTLFLENHITATDKSDEYVASSNFLETFENQILTDAGSLSSDEIDQIIEYYQLKSVDGNPLSKARKFNLLVKTHLGPIEDDSSLAYLKGEACQNIYVNWKQTLETTRRKLPFGVAQMGKAFRNEITVKQYMFRTREFEQIDMQYFVKPPEFVKKEENGKNLEKDHFEWFAYWKEERMKFYTEFLGYNSANLKWHQHSPEELVFYAAEAWDIYYNFGQMGYKEMEGVHNRTDYDTRQHQKFSGTDLTYLDPETNQRYLPYIVEMSLGVNRLFLSTLFEFYTEEEIKSSENTELENQIKKLEDILQTLKNIKLNFQDEF